MTEHLNHYLFAARKGEHVVDFELFATTREDAEYEMDIMLAVTKDYDDYALISSSDHDENEVVKQELAP